MKRSPQELPAPLADARNKPVTSKHLEKYQGPSMPCREKRCRHWTAYRSCERIWQFFEVPFNAYGNVISIDLISLGVSLKQLTETRVTVNSINLQESEPKQIKNLSKKNCFKTQTNITKSRAISVYRSLSPGRLES